MDLKEVLRSLNDPMTPARIESLQTLLPEMQAQVQISQNRLQQVVNQPRTRRKSSRQNVHVETQREAVQEIQAYLTTLEITITRVQRALAQHQRLQESRRFSQNIDLDGW